MAMPLAPVPGMEQAKAVPTKDPVMLIVDDIQAKLDELRGALGGEVETEETEVEPQSDEEVMAGLAPKKKEPAGGSPFTF